MKKLLLFFINLIPIKKVRHQLRNDFGYYSETKNGLTITQFSKHIEVVKDNKKILIPKELEVYIYDLYNDFDLYFNAVKPKITKKYKIVDYRYNKIHFINGFDLHKVMLPSFTETINPLLQYLNFANLSANSVVFDLGAYCGLASIIFDREISKFSSKSKGKVIAVEADPKNIKAIKYNFKQYKNKTERNIEFLPYGVWRENTVLKFASQGHMGASINHVGHNRGNEIAIKTICLSSIAKKYKLEKVDFIKCDIEGAEAEIFKDKDFFKKYSPKIIIECHYIDLEQTKNTKQDVIKILSEYGYTCNEVYQDGFNLPLLECYKA